MPLFLKQKDNLAKINQSAHNTMVDLLGIEFTCIGDDFISATMPVDHRTKQSFGLLHGGASVVLSETIGSVASILCIDTKKQHCVGLEINANHIKSVREGIVTGTATPYHIGKKTHVWSIRIVDSQNNLVCISRLTTMILSKER